MNFHLQILADVNDMCDTIAVPLGFPEIRNASVYIFISAASVTAVFLRTTYIDGFISS